MSAYTDFELITGAEVGPDGTLAFVSDRSGRPQVWLRTSTGLRCLATPGSVRRATWHPAGERLLVLIDPDGTEAHGLAEVALDGALDWIVDDPAVRAEIGPPYTSSAMPYSPDGRRLAYASTARDPEVFDVVVREVGVERIVLEGDDRYFGMCFSPDGGRLLVLRLHQNSEHDLFVVELGTDEVTHLTPHEGPAKYEPVAWAPDGESIYVCTTQGRDLLGLARMGLDGSLDWIDAPDDCEVVGAGLSPDGTTLAWARNRDGFSELLTAAVDGDPRGIDALPPGTMAQEHGFDGQALRFAPDGRLLVVHGRPDAATEVHLVDLAGATAQQLTDAGPDLPEGLVGPEVVRVPSFDGLPIPCLLYRPHGASASSPVPVVMTVHGGPEAQALPVYGPLEQALLARGIGVIAPNFRGSSGYGLDFQRLVYRDWGGDDLRDLGAVAGFLDGVDWVDGGRLGVHGASYGGFAAQGCLARQPELWRVGVSECGPCDLLDDIDTLPPTWRRRTVGWIGDPDDPADRARLVDASPITHAARIEAPLLILHGENDTRVDPRQSHRMYARLTELDKPVRLELHPGVGHEVSREGMAESIALIVDWFADRL